MTIFNDFSEAYDLMFPREERIRSEEPFWRELVARHGVKSVLDCACGTGGHPILFARLGCAAYGSDLSPNMVEAAMANAVAAGTTVNLRVSSFTELTAAFKEDERFDAVICVGNSLTLAPTDDDVAKALREMYAVLNPGGICVLNIFNWDRLAAEGLRIMPAAVAEKEGRELTFLRVFHHRGDVIHLNIVVVTRDGAKAVTEILTARQRPVGPARLVEYVKTAGFTSWEATAGYSATPFDPASSDILTLVARKA
ncbi:class I SAM-dependent methyltransferase [Geobacter pickeringii]|uniref:Methyltransferase domain-containing protein n=1 Tax=Geobacter pickeringii TaxID=345632 RepID=A0A0B5BIS4_9BACT|nr:class I SAM-dependent methyltransferase [Geobacter pickeringii]AJE04365.1 hypothetical protein GPICK_14290 [Geobacter pickeringii]